METVTRISSENMSFFKIRAFPNIILNSYTIKNLMIITFKTLFTRSRNYIFDYNFALDVFRLSQFLRWREFNFHSVYFLL